MGKLAESLGDYFFGTKTKLRYQRQRNFYREFHTKREDAYKHLPAKERNEAYKTHISLDDRLKESRGNERFFLAFSKWIPNAIDIASVGIAAITREPLWLSYIAFGEAMRITGGTVLRRDALDDKEFRVKTVETEGIFQEIQRREKEK